MKYIADRNYKDLVLNKYIEKGAVLEEEYEKIELTEERKDYLINERKLYVAVEEKNKDDKDTIKNKKGNKNK